MQCPSCQDSVLSMTERQGVEIDYCPKCRGVWLDRGELDKIIEKSAVANTETASPAVPQHSGQHYKGYKRKKSFLEELFD